MYGSRPPSHHAGSHQNPPQPEWRSSQPPPSTSYNPNNAYNPSTYAPIHPLGSTASPPPPLPSPPHNVATTTWGVRYNQHLAHDLPPPPLPPRADDLYSAPSPPPPPPPPRPTSTIGSASQPPNWGFNNSGPPQTTQSPPVPPPRPPIPPAYQNEMQNTSQATQTIQGSYGPLYSHQTPTHHYDPVAQQSTSKPQTPGYAPSDYNSRVSSYHQRQPSPLMSPPPTVPTSPPVLPPTTAFLPNASAQWSAAQPNTFTPGASILGHGEVSDWEHLTPTPGDVDDLQQKVSDVGHSIQKIDGPAYVSQNIMAQSPQTQNAALQAPGQDFAESTKWSPHPLNTQHTSPSPHPSSSHSTLSQENAISPQERSDTIDGVIQAWSQNPVSPIIRPQDEPQESTATAETIIPPATAQPQMPSQSFPDESQPIPQLTALAPRSTSPQTMELPKVPEAQAKPETARAEAEANLSPAKAIDPYDDLDPWSKSSLVRYVTMLRKEAVAESEEEKFKIFTGFVAKEIRLREVLYNIEPAAVETKQTDQPRKSDSEAAVPVPVDSGLIPIQSEMEIEHPTKSRHDSTDSEEILYSPGGRPILAKPPLQPVGKEPKEAGVLQRSVTNSQGRGGSAYGGGSATTQPTLNSLTTEPPQPAYTPFRYAEGPSQSVDGSASDQLGYQAYSALRQASAESGRAMATSTLRAPAVQEPGSQKNPGSIQMDETFLGIIREKSVSYRGQAEIPNAGIDIEELATLIPDPFPVIDESAEIGNIRKKMEVYSDDFRYIYVTTENWELSARDRREALDQGRLHRQEESESHIDSLFNEKEIGYADINPLEEEFRQREAQTQLAEERQELDSYVRRVFKPLDIRLKEEIVELKALYQQAMEELSPDKIQSNSRSKYQISNTMKTINTLANKLEARYQKRLDLGLERERHRKKAERRPLIFLGDSRALKKLDAGFEKMEKQNIVDAAKDRDVRANKVTDVFDEAILYALGNHQSVLDKTATKTRQLSGAIMEWSSLSDADKELLLRSISALTKMLAEDAESMLTSFREADSRLNDADYQISVAEAQYSNADSEVFRRLEEEKKKEDAKINEDHDSKLESIRKAPAEIASRIDAVLVAMHKEPGPGPGPWRRPLSLVDKLSVRTGSQPRARSPSSSNLTADYPLDEPEHEHEPHPGEILMPGPPPRRSSAEMEQQERLRKALEDAKKRNMAKNFVSPR